MSEEIDDIVVSESRSPILLIAFLATNFLVVAVGVFLAYQGSFPTKKQTNEDILMQQWKDAQKSDANEDYVYKLVPFNVNLSGTPRRFVRLSLQLEMLDERGFEEISDLGAEARDSILKLINEKTVADIRSVQGKLILKDEIMAEVNSILTDGIVKNAYFTEFAIQ